MTMKDFFKIELYCFSLLPVFPILILRTIKFPIPMCGLNENWEFLGFGYIWHNYALPIILFFITLILLFFYFKFKFDIKGTTSHGEVEEIKPVDYEIVSFCVTYFLPLCFIDKITWDYTQCYIELLIIAIVFITIGIILIKSNLYYLNPVLPMLGIHVMKGNFKYGTEDNNTLIENVVIISRKNISSKSSIMYKEIEENQLYIFK